MTYLWYFLLCFLHPIALPTPEAITISGGSISFGAFNAFILAYIATILGIITLYTIVKLLGTNIIKKLFKQEHLDRYINYVQRNEIIITGLLFILPILPDEVVCVGAALTGIKTKTFISIALISKLLTTFFYSYSVELSTVFGIAKEDVFLLQLIAFLLLFIIKYMVKVFQKKLKASLN